MTPRHPGHQRSMATRCPRQRRLVATRGVTTHWHPGYWVVIRINLEKYMDSPVSGDTGNLWLPFQKGKCWRQPNPTDQNPGSHAISLKENALYAWTIQQQINTANTHLELHPRQSWMSYTRSSIIPTPQSPSLYPPTISAHRTFPSHSNLYYWLTPRELAKLSPTS